MLRLILSAFFFCIINSVGSVHAQPLYDPVYIRAENGVEGNGVRFRSANGCVTITADHVFRNATIAEIVPLKTGVDRANLGPRHGALDIAMLTQSHQSIEECAVWPTRPQIERALAASGLREVRYVDAGGVETVIEVNLIRRSDSEIWLAISPNPLLREQPFFQPGMSGAVVVFGGVPVATLQKVTTENEAVVTATRLDEAMRLFDGYIPQYTRAEREPVRHKPFDIGILPKEYRDIVRQARRTKKRVEQVMREAEKVKIKAENAAAIARQYPRSQPTNGYAHFTADESKNEYAGQIWSVGTRFGSEGYGISIEGTHNSFGNEHHCRFVRGKGCHGIGVILFKENPSNTNGLKAYYGYFEEGRRKGLGYTVWVDYHGDESWNVMGEAAPGVWKDIKDGKVRTYEGGVDDTWHGKGVVWDHEGQLLAIGEWNMGEQVEDHKAAWRAGMLD